MILDVLKFLLAIPAALLPEFYRRRLSSLQTVAMRAPAAASGTLQMLGAFFLLSYGFYDFFVQSLGTPEVGAVLEQGQSRGGTALLSAFGVIFFVAYLLQPITIILLYLSLEGFVRALEAIISDQVLPTLPLTLVSLVHKRLIQMKEYRERIMAAPDIVLPGDGNAWHLKILSSLPKDEWDEMVTIACGEKTYRVIGREQGDDTHPYGYLLQRKPAGEIIRSLRHYELPAGTGRQTSLLEGRCKDQVTGG